MKYFQNLIISNLRNNNDKLIFFIIPAGFVISSILLFLLLFNGNSIFDNLFGFHGIKNNINTSSINNSNTNESKQEEINR